MPLQRIGWRKTSDVHTDQTCRCVNDVLECRKHMVMLLNGAYAPPLAPQSNASGSESLSGMHYPVLISSESTRPADGLRALGT